MDRLIESPRYCVNHIAIKPGAGMSLQKHSKRAEHWVVVEGQAQVTKDGDTFDLGPNESTFIPRGVSHRLQNPGKETVEIIEIQTGSTIDEDDIERLDQPAFG
jgi:mannose-1-phosphate guanylyltransferase/mannose-6-phosphate isomerase